MAEDAAVSRHDAGGLIPGIDAGLDGGFSGGCGCRAGTAEDAPLRGLALLGLLALGRARRRR